MNPNDLELLHVPWPEQREEEVPGWIRSSKLYGCKPSMIVWENAARLESIKLSLDSMIIAAGFELLNSFIHGFPGEGAGYTYGGVLGESMLSVHTWPERKMGADILLHYCNPSRDNSDKADALDEMLRREFLPKEMVYKNPIQSPI